MEVDVFIIATIFLELFPPRTKGRFAFCSNVQPTMTGVKTIVPVKFSEPVVPAIAWCAPYHQPMFRTGFFTVRPSDCQNVPTLVFAHDQAAGLRLGFQRGEMSKGWRDRMRTPKFCEFRGIPIVP